MSFPFPSLGSEGLYMHIKVSLLFIRLHEGKALIFSRLPYAQFSKYIHYPSGRTGQGS